MTLSSDCLSATHDCWRKVNNVLDNFNSFIYVTLWCGTYSPRGRQGNLFFSATLLTTLSQQPFREGIHLSTCAPEAVARVSLFINSSYLHVPQECKWYSLMNPLILLLGFEIKTQLCGRWWVTTTSKSLAFNCPWILCTPLFLRGEDDLPLIES